MKQMEDHLKRFAAGFGIHGMRHSGRVPNTRKALAVSEFARVRGRLDEFRSQVMEAYWMEGRDIEDSAVLGETAVASSLDPQEARLAADDPVYLGRVDDLRLEASAMGISGIPAFIFAGERIDGCQPYEVLAGAAIRAGARQRGHPNG